MSDLEQILNGDDVTDVVVDAVDEEQPPIVTEEPKGEEESASPAPKEEPALDHAALLAERRKRQEREAELQEVRAQLAERDKTPPPSIWDDENAAFKAHKESILTEAEQRAEQRFHTFRISDSANKARERHADFDSVREVFASMCQQNPLLEQKLYEVNDPGEFAYTEGKKQMELQEYGGDWDALVNARVEARLKERLTEQPQKIPASLADSQSSRITGEQAYSPPTLEQILKG